MTYGYVYDIKTGEEVFVRFEDNAVVTMQDVTISHTELSQHNLRLPTELERETLRLEMMTDYLHDLPMSDDYCYSNGKYDAQVKAVKEQEKVVEALRKKESDNA